MNNEPLVNLTVTLNAAHAEIARLRAENARLLAENADYFRLSQTLVKRVESLDAALVEWKAMYGRATGRLP